jgi:hypothetical protein
MKLRCHVARAEADRRAIRPPESKEHIVAVGVGDHASTAARWTLDEVLAAMDLADIFYTRGHNR